MSEARDDNVDERDRAAEQAARSAPDEERAAGPAAEAEGPDASAEPEASSDDSAERVEEDFSALVEDVRRERDEYLELARRARADFENYRRRVGGETAAAEHRGKAALARELVPALDNLERALRAAGIDPEPTGDPDGDPPSEEVSAQRALAEGVALVYRELRETLERAGVESYDPTGERFDPNLHEAIATSAADDVESGVVVETLEKGYRLSDQVLRAARVVVSG